MKRIVPLLGIITIFFLVYFVFLRQEPHPNSKTELEHFVKKRIVRQVLLSSYNQYTEQLGDIIRIRPKGDSFITSNSAGEVIIADTGFNVINKNHLNKGKSVWQVDARADTLIVWVRGQGIQLIKGGNVIFKNPVDSLLQYDDIFFSGDKFWGIATERDSSMDPYLVYGSISHAGTTRHRLAGILKGIYRENDGQQLSVSQVSGEFSESDDSIFYILYHAGIIIEIPKSGTGESVIRTADSTKIPGYAEGEIFIGGKTRTVQKLTNEQTLHYSAVTYNGRMCALSNVVNGATKTQCIDIYSGNGKYEYTAMLPALNTRYKANYLLAGNGSLYAIDTDRRLLVKATLP